MLEDPKAAAIDEAYGRTEPPEEFLADPALWRAYLVEVLDGVTDRLRTITAEITAWKAAPSLGAAEYRDGLGVLAGRRNRALHFRRKIETRLRYVNALIRERGQRFYDEEADPVLRLTSAARLWQSRYGDSDAQRTLFAIAALDAWNALDDLPAVPVSPEP